MNIQQNIPISCWKPPIAVAKRHRYLFSILDNTDDDMKPNLVVLHVIDDEIQVQQGSLCIIHTDGSLSRLSVGDSYNAIFSDTGNHTLQVLVLSMDELISGQL